MKGKASLLLNRSLQKRRNARESIEFVKKCGQIVHSKLTLNYAR